MKALTRDRGSDHLRKGLLTDFSYDRFWLALFAKIGHLRGKVALPPAKIRESVMASFETPNFKAPKHAFDSDDLAILDEAFDATWTDRKLGFPCAG